MHTSHKTATFERWSVGQENRHALVTWKAQMSALEACKERTLKSTLGYKDSCNGAKMGPDRGIIKRTEFRRRSTYGAGSQQTLKGIACRVVVCSGHG